MSCRLTATDVFVCYCIVVLFRASSTVPFNLIALKCGHCGSYNTRRMGVVTTEGGSETVDADDSQ